MTTDPKDYWENIKPVVRGMPSYNLKEAPCRIKLNQNESPFAIPEEVRSEILSFAKEHAFSRYPALLAVPLVEKLSELLKVPKDWVLVGHGSNELIWALIQAVLGRGDRVVVPIPAFALFTHYPKVVEAELVEVPAKEDLSFDVERLLSKAGNPETKLILIASPNSPTGAILALRDVENLCRATRGLVLLDEAYFQFAKENALSLLTKHPNLILLRTFSKAFHLAGMRVGYLLAQPEISEAVSKCKLPFSVDALAQMAAMAMLARQDWVNEKVGYIVRERERLFLELGTLQGVRPYPSQANFILFRVPDARKVFEGLLEQGILIRDVSHYPQLADCLRVTVGLEDENNAFLEALRGILLT
jgi:histidinol-phosphate aminotransferase